MEWIALLSLLSVFAVVVFIAVFLSPRKADAAQSKEALSVEPNTPHLKIIPSLGIKITSAGNVDLPIAVDDWRLSISDDNFINAMCFLKNNDALLIEIDKGKSNLSNFRFDIHNYLVNNGIIQPNKKLI
jgi:hypothetical protein